MDFPSAPISYAIEITLACNNFCPGCANVLHPDPQEALAQWRTLFDCIAPPQHRIKYAEIIRITGGEPTLHQEFSSIIHYIDSFGIPHATFTNGRWEQPDSVIELFRECDNFVGLLVSLHGSTASSHNAFSGKTDREFEETCINIQRAADAGLEVFTNTVLTKYNCEQIEEIIDLSRKLGASHAVFNRYLGESHSIEPTENQLRHAILLIEQLQCNGVDCHLGDCVPPCFVRNSSVGSNSGIEHCAIAPDGSVRPENLTNYVFGNIFEQSIEEIWQSERAQWYRSQISKNCLECIELPHCRGGCRSLIVEYRLEKDPLMKEPIRETEPETIEFHPDWKPVPHFTLREESFGYLLCRYNWSVPVMYDAKPFIDAIMSQQYSLFQLRECFGDDVLEFIGHLYKERCIGFE